MFDASGVTGDRFLVLTPDQRPVQLTVDRFILVPPGEWWTADPKLLQFILSSFPEGSSGLKGARKHEGQGA
jgi:hypothetical protein